MDRIRTVIADDEAVARRGLEALVRRHQAFEVVAVCADGRDAISKVIALVPDLLLIDIQMPEVGGFDVLDRIPPERLPLVIFITAFEEYAVRAFEVRALDYILKPVSPGRFDEALERAAARIRDRRVAEYGRRLRAATADIRTRAAGTAAGKTDVQRIMVKVGHSFEFVEVEDIEWIEGADYYVTLHANGREFLHRESMRHLASRLEAAHFVRIHVSTLVNLTKVREIRRDDRGGTDVVLAGGRRLKVARRRRRGLLALGAVRFGSDG